MDEIAIQQAKAELANIMYKLVALEVVRKELEENKKKIQSEFKGFFEFDENKKQRIQEIIFKNAN